MNAASPHSTTSSRDWLYLGVFIVVLLAITAIPYFYAQRLAGADKHFMGIVFNIPDHFQYFSWMRESQTHILVANQLTPEDSTPLLFNFFIIAVTVFFMKALNRSSAMGLPRKINVDLG